MTKKKDFFLSLFALDIYTLHFFFYTSVHTSTRNQQ